MASTSSALMRFQSACVTCVRGGHQAVLRYRDFLLDPGTLFTMASLLLLIAATIQTPDGLVNSAHAHTWLYLAAALAGSVYIWWSAIQGISEVHAEVLPAQKVEIVKQLQAQGWSVAFVGDGVNDGPALATANVGVAMGLGGTDVAIETAEIALLSDDLAKLPHLLSLSRQAMRAIKQNLIFSLSVLAIAVGLAIPGILSPVTGALLHELSSIPVIANSARLIGIKEQSDPWQPVTVRAS